MVLAILNWQIVLCLLTGLKFTNMYMYIYLFMACHILKFENSSWAI
jgi:hypothetical protein